MGTSQACNTYVTKNHAKLGRIVSEMCDLKVGGKEVIKKAALLCLEAPIKCHAKKGSDARVR